MLCFQARSELPVELAVPQGQCSHEQLQKVVQHMGKHEVRLTILMGGVIYFRNDYCLLCTTRGNQ